MKNKNTYIRKLKTMVGCLYYLQSKLSKQNIPNTYTLQIIQTVDFIINDWAENVYDTAIHRLNECNLFQLKSLFKIISLFSINGWYVIYFN